MKKSLMKTLGLGLMLSCSLSLAACGNGETPVATAPENVISADAQYLEALYGVVVASDLSAESLSEDFSTITGEEVVLADANGLTVVEAAVNAADFGELAVNYTGKNLAEGEENPYLACAIDTGMITEAQGKELAKNETISAETATQLLSAVVEVTGEGRNYLGMSTDTDIYAKINQAWDSFVLFDDAQLTEIGRMSVENQITTGYGIKSDAYAANFIPELTIQYGHSDIKHAHQLLAILENEGLEAKVQLEPKISIYQYLLEWGPIGEPTPTYAIKQYGDIYLVHAVEYDLQLEFNNQEDMESFNQLILDYAKKGDSNSDGSDMIYGAWWQPLYSVTNTTMPAEDYNLIYDCVVANNGFSIHPFTTEEAKDATIEALQGLAGDLEVTAVPIYCNNAFYNYITGSDHQ